MSDPINNGWYPWPMPSRTPKKDLNQLAASIVRQATEERAPIDTPPEPAKNPAAVALGRLGGLKGGKNRMASMSEEERKELARKAAAARWPEKKKASG